MDKYLPAWMYVFAVSGNMTPSTERILVNAISEEPSSRGYGKHILDIPPQVWPNVN
jgi:hypothetical protein